MVAIDQNMLYIIIAVIVVVIILLAVLIRRRRTGKGPKNLNQYLAEEAEHKKMEIAEQELGSKPKSSLLKSPMEKVEDIKENTSQTMHKIIYLNTKIEEKGEDLTQEKPMNLKKQIKAIEKKGQKLNERI